MNDKVNKIIIAIDGFSSSGKSTMARELARRIGYVYVDSGAMYRAVTLYALRHGMIASDGTIDVSALVAALPGIHISFAKPDPATGVSDTLLNGEDVEQEIRGMEVSDHVSPVSAIREVRQRLTALQQELGKAKGIVMDGRDIGTTVFPQAEMKVFVDASPQVRAMRRYKELLAKGQNPEYADVLANIEQRDFTDRNRKESPLRLAPDAHLLDNDRLTPVDQMQWLLELYQKISGASAADASAGTTD